MRIRGSGRLVLGAGLVGLLLGSGALSASATPTYSSWWYDTVGTYNIQSRSELYDNGAAQGYTRNQQLVNLPAGHLGALGRLYKQSTNALCKQGGWVYNGSSAYAVGGSTTAGASCGAGAYYSYSVARAWNVNTSQYETIYNYYSPAKNF